MACRHDFSSCTTIILVLLIGFVGCVHSTTSLVPENVTTISLVGLDEIGRNGQAFHNRTKLGPNSNSFIVVEDIPTIVAFIIVQIHAPESNVTLSYDGPDPYYRSNGSISGSNLGLDIYVNGTTSARLAVSNNQNIALDALVAIVAYSNKAPTPGGCNSEFDIEVSPFQKLSVGAAMVTVDGQAASAPRINGEIPPCDKYRVKLEMYRMYLPELDFSPETYFDGILKMITVENIIENGQKIQPAVGASSLRRVYSAYPGTGSVYAIIATDGNFSAAYVPIASYACTPLTEKSSCYYLNTGIAQAICGIVLFFGFFMTFAGRRCLGFEVIFFGAVSGGLLTYSIMAVIGYFTTPTVLGIVLGASFLTGIAWLILSFGMGMSRVVTFLDSMTLGFFLASTVYFWIADNTPFFENNASFWLTYIGIMLPLPFVLMVLPFSTNVVRCAILGAYSIILPFDYYFGSNLKFIIINIIRRATVKGFNVAVLQPPYQGTDKWLIAFLIIIPILGIYAQVGKMCCCKRGNRTTVYWNDHEPILSSPRNGRRVLVLRRNDHVETNAYQ